jgi:hypothetical protein
VRFGCPSRETEGKGVNVEALRAGNEVLTPEGQWRGIRRIKRVSGKFTVYNFEVADNHDYFVGKKGVLVHNNNCQVPGSPAIKESDYIDKTTGNSIHNRQTNITRTEFEQNLINEGYSSSTSKDGEVTILEKGKNRYTVRSKAKYTGGPTAEFLMKGKLKLKIRLR